MSKTSLLIGLALGILLIGAGIVVGVQGWLILMGVVAVAGLGIATVKQ